MPFLLEDNAGVARGNDWAQGFTRGMKLRREDWAELFEDEDRAGILVPILALAHEILILTCGRTRSRWIQSNGKRWWWASPHACLASIATFFPAAISHREQNVRRERTGVPARRWDGVQEMLRGGDGALMAR
jgi:hypothetical protein